GSAFEEWQRQHTHPNLIAAMNALEALSDDSANAEQVRAFGGPVAGAAGAVLSAGQDDRGHMGGAVEHGSTVDRHHLANGSAAGPLACALGLCRRAEIPCHAAFGAGGKEIADANVGKRPAEHDAV